jgi:hypothetical protein
MNYNTGSTVKVRLYSGQIVTANIIDIVSRSAGRKIHIAYENSTTVVNPAQIIEVAEAPPVAETRVPSSVSAAPNSAFAGAAASKSAAVATPVPNSAGVAARIPGSAAVAAAPAAAARKRPTSQVVREIAEDYLQLARSNGATPDALRESNYRWLIKLADKIRAKSPLRPL